MTMDPFIFKMFPLKMQKKRTVCLIRKCGSNMGPLSMMGLDTGLLPGDQNLTCHAL